MTKLNIVTKNVNGRDQGINLKKLEIEFREINPNVISLTEVRREDIKNFRKKMAKNNYFKNFKLFTPLLCSNKEMGCTSKLGTVLLVEKKFQEEYRFMILPSEILKHIMRHNDMPCDIRECHIISYDGNLEISSLYMPSGLSSLKYTSVQCLKLLPKILREKLQHSSKNFVLTGDLNVIIPESDNASRENYVNSSIWDYVGDVLKDLSAIQKNYEAWHNSKDENKGRKATYFKAEKPYSKLDYIFSKLPIEKTINHEPNFELSDHSTLQAIYTID
ncbi:TPA: hypothetical protein ACGOON_001300 [Streptococcus suis]